MKLQQLRFFKAIIDNQLNVSAAADALFTSQPGVSKQIRLLEEELGVSLFERSGKRLSRLTEAGEAVFQRAQSILAEVDNIKTIGLEFDSPDSGELRIATTHTQARYVLPEVLTQYRQQWPNIGIHLHQGTGEQIVQMLADGSADLAITSGPLLHTNSLQFIPCYRWHRVLLTPTDHALTRQDSAVSMTDLAAESLITYSFSVGSDSSLLKAFQTAGVTPDIALTARDADVIKTYVKLGMGVGLVAEMAVEEQDLESFSALDTSHMLAPLTTWIAYPKQAKLRGFTQAFLDRFVDHVEQRYGSIDPHETTSDHTRIAC